jgi:PsbP
VDPVRISSLTDFGTAEEVAAKVVLAEVNRDGVFKVKLMEDPVAVQGGDDSVTTTFYQLNYLSSGKRGEKRFVAKFYVQNQKLFALTAQCKEENYASVKEGMLEAVKSFRIVQ